MVPGDRGFCFYKHAISYFKCRTISAHNQEDIFRPESKEVKSYKVIFHIFLNIAINMDYYGQVIPYFGSVIVAVAIMLVGSVAANFLHGLVRHALQAGGLRTSDTLALITKWAILVFTFMAALVQLSIAPDLIRVLFTGLVAMLALAGGLAFGLGGRDQASRFLDRLRRDISEDR